MNALFVALGAWERKGFPLLLDALRRPAAAGVRLAVAGRPALGEEYLLRAGADLVGAGRVEFLGQRDDMPAVYAGADVLVCASHYETCSLAMLEALHHGLAIVAVRVNGVDEMLEHGVNGFVVDRDADALAAALQQIAGDPGQLARFRAAARRKSLAFAPALIAARTLDVYPAGRHMKRILYLDITGRGGGSNHSLLALLARVPRDRYEPQVVVGTPPDPRLWRGWPVEHLSMAGFDNYDFFPALCSLPWIHHALRFFLRFPADYIRCRRLLARRRPDLVHINVGQALTFGLAARAAGIPVVWHVRELVAENAWGRWQQRVYRRCAARIVANSAAVARRLPLCADRVVVVPNPVDPMPAPSEAVNDFRARHGLEGRFSALLLGTPSRAKGAFFLADVAEALDDARMIFVIAGELVDAPAGPAHRMLRRLRRLARPAEPAALRARWADLVAQGRAVFVGHVPTAVACAACDVLVCPNVVSESFGRTVIEAHAAAKPVLASDRPPFDETIEHGRSGWLLPPRVEEWARQLRALACDPACAGRAGAAGWAGIGRYDPGEHARTVLSIYSEVLP